MFLRPLVAVDGSPSSQRALELAVDVARAMGSVLTLITVAPPPASYVALVGVTVQRMQAELERWAAGTLQSAAAAVPDEVLAHTVQRRGHVGREILAELERGGHDLVVLGSRGRSRAEEGLLGSVNGYLHFHARVPILSVPDGELPAEG